MENKVDERPTLYYSGTCPRCRFLSRIVGWLSLDTLHRVPMDYWEAVAFYRENPRYAGKLVLFHDRGVTAGSRVFLAVPRLIVRTWLAALRPSRPAGEGSR